MKVVKRASPPASKICPKCMANFEGDALYCPADGIPLRAAEVTTSEHRNRDPYIGQVLAGHLRIDERIGSGAMGKVYRAYQEGIGRHVAIKILHGELTGNPQIAARFEKEATVASRLEHPNVVNIYLAGRTPDGAMYIAMEYLHGVSLQSALSAGVGAFPLRRVLHILLQVCHAVGEAHARNIVHRDIKPENIMLIRRGEDSDFVKVLDFGVARFHSSDQSMATATGLVFGTARYISPEGAKGERVGAQGDVYSIATVAYQLLAGKTPFEGDSAVSLLIQHIQDEPPHLGSSPSAPHVPPSLAELVMQNLQKDPTKRSQDARAFGRSLLEWMSQNGFTTGDAAAVSSPAREPLLEGVSHPSRSQQESSNSIARHEFHFDDYLESVDTPVKSVGHGNEQPKEYKTHPWTAPQEIGLVLPSHHRPDTGKNSEPIAATEPADLDSVSENLSDTPSVPTHGMPKSFVFGMTLLVAAILGAFVLWGHRGGNSPSRPNIDLDDYLRKAEQAFQRGQMRSPPAENVYDLTGEALLQSPEDQRFVELREKSADELITRALEAMKVDPRQALSFLDDALLFEPESAVAKKLRRDVEEGLSGGDKTPGSVASAGSARGRLERSPQSPQDRVVALVDVRPEHPRVGQSVRLAVRLQGTSTNIAGLMEEPLFELRGAGFLQSSKIRPSFDPMDGSWNSTFTFFAPGVIDVTFSGLHRKSFLKVVRRVNVEPGSGNDPSSDPRGASAPGAGHQGTSSTPQEDASVGTPASPSATPPSNDRGAKWL